MITDKELNAKIETVCTEFSGQLDDLYAVVGMIVVGRLFGWKVMRLVSRRGHWALAAKLFGDPKTLMRERGVLAHKSVGLKICDECGKYWEVIQGVIHTNAQDRKSVH